MTVGIVLGLLVWAVVVVAIVVWGWQALAIGGLCIVVLLALLALAPRGGIPL